MGPEPPPATTAVLRYLPLSIHRRDGVPVGRWLPFEKSAVAVRRYDGMIAVLRLPRRHALVGSLQALEIRRDEVGGCRG